MTYYEGDFYSAKSCSAKYDSDFGTASFTVTSSHDTITIEQIVVNNRCDTIIHCLSGNNNYLAVNYWDMNENAPVPVDSCTYTVDVTDLDGAPSNTKMTYYAGDSTSAKTCSAKYDSDAGTARFTVTSSQTSLRVEKIAVNKRTDNSTYYLSSDDNYLAISYLDMEENGSADSYTYTVSVFDLDSSPNKTKMTYCEGGSGSAKTCSAKYDSAEGTATFTVKSSKDTLAVNSISVNDRSYTTPVTLYSYDPDFFISYSEMEKKNPDPDEHKADPVPDYRNTDPYRIVITGVEEEPYRAEMDYSLGWDGDCINGEYDYAAQTVTFSVAAGDSEEPFCINSVDIDGCTLYPYVTVDNEVRGHKFEFAELSDEQEELEGDFLIVINNVRRKASILPNRL